MASYLILTAPGASRNDGAARFIADRFSGLAFVAPALWLLAHRLWLAGIVVVVLRMGAIWLMLQPGFLFAGLAGQLCLALLVAFEGPAFLAQKLTRQGWLMRDVIPADGLETAELLYFNEEVEPALAQTADHTPGFSSGHRPHPGNQAVLGLLDFGGGR